MNFTFIANIAKENPALARLVECALAAGVSYALAAVVEGQAFSMQGLVVAILTPLYMAVSKWRRDLEK